MSMFSQGSFRPLNEPPRHFIRPHDPHDSPFMDDESDTSSRRTSTDLAHHQHQQQQQHQKEETPFYVKPDQVGALIRRLSSDSLDIKEDEHIHAPVPKHPQPNHASTLRPPGAMDGSPGSSPGKPRSIRASPSPSRGHHHGLSALSPLQMFSPLEGGRQLKPKPRTPSDASMTSGAGLSRSSSVTRSLSRRQSLIASAAKWSPDQDYEQENYAKFSRLTIVKAPAEKDKGMQHRRSKSYSALSPFTALSTKSEAAATSDRGPRRSFAAASFAGFSPLANVVKTPVSPPMPQGELGDSANRIVIPGNENAPGMQRRTLSPEQILDIARRLDTPIALPEGGFKGAELKRRKSYGSASTRKSFGSAGGPQTPEIEPIALEPVEYVQMDEETLLPFVDRPSEVDELIVHPSNEKTFHLLKAAFPKHAPRQKWKDIPPTEWCWDEFILHLTTVTRAECPDYAWVFKARQAVRQHSIALWEKVGVILGCDPDLLNAGGEDGIPPSWGGLGLGEEGEYDPYADQVYIEGLAAIDPMDLERAERAFAEGFGEIVEDEGEQAAAGMTALLGAMETIGEGDEEPVGKLGLTPAQRAGQKKPAIDPLLMSPTQGYDDLQGDRKGRSKSFVGLQIMTSPISPGSPDLTPQTPHWRPMQFDRGPEAPLFPSSFSSMSAQPNLGRSASVATGGVRPMKNEDFARVRRNIVRKPSGAGLSESAITFASESDYGHSAGYDQRDQFV